VTGVCLDRDVSDHESVTVDHRNPTPLYQQLAAILREQIKSGKLAPGAPIPSETDLQQVHEVSRVTARKAVAVLRDDGLVITLPQRGTFVAERPAD
jgi:DNA-binding GntR family transcriptional regulator